MFQIRCIFNTSSSINHVLTRIRLFNSNFFYFFLNLYSESPIFFILQFGLQINLLSIFSLSWSNTAIVIHCISVITWISCFCFFFSFLVGPVMF